MTKKHFVAVAAAIRSVRDYDTARPIHDVIVRDETLALVAGRLADAFEEVNDNFDRERFLAACRKAA